MNERLYQCWLDMGLTPEQARLACENSSSNPQNDQTHQSRGVDLSDVMQPVTRFTDF
jgi:hypothetical protein